ncbi:MAG: hypothetical protein WC635_04195 [Bacteriovorax sp.]|jgi:hypothetical protein
MTSIVLELQKNTLDKSVLVSELLRKAFLVAKKLKQNDFVDWLNYEINGYPKDGSYSNFPPYRKLQGTPQIFNPYHGYQPIIFSTQKQFLAYSVRHCYNSIPELEHMLVNSKSSGRFQMDYNAEITKHLMKAMDMDLHPTLMIQASSIAQILDSIKNAILSWTLQLEEDGILGEELSFTKEDQEKVISPIYNVTNFYGNVSNSQIQQGTKESQQEIYSP